MSKSSPKWSRRPHARPGEIAEAALAKFVQKGFPNTSVDEIAAAAGVTKGAVYHHFENKEELLRAAVQECFDQAFRQADLSLQSAPGATAIERVQAILRAAWGLWCSERFNGVMHLALFDPGPAVPELGDAFLREGPFRGWAVLGKEIKQGQANGDIRADIDPQATARLITCGLAFQAVLLSRDRASTPRKRERALTAALDLIATMLRPHAER